MKFYISLLLSILAFSKAYSQRQDDFLIGFFVSGFNNDSVHVFLNEKKIIDVRLKANPSLGQCNEVIFAKLTDSAQSLTIFEAETQKRFLTIIKKGYKYLYIRRFSKDNFQFDYSNKLSLPE